MVARGQRDARAESGGEVAPWPAGPCALAGAPRPRSRRAELAAEPLGPRARLNEWGRRAGAGLQLPVPPPPPRPRLLGGSGSCTRSPASQLALAAPPACQGWGLVGLGPSRRRGTRRVLGARPEHPPLLPAWPAPRGRRRTRPAPSPYTGTPRCGQMWADMESGRRHGGGAKGRRIPPLPWGTGFLLRRFLFTEPSKVGHRRAFLCSAPARVKRWGWQPAESRPVGKEPRIPACWQRAEGRAQVSRGRGCGDPSSYTPPLPFHPGSLPHPLGRVAERALAHWGRGAEMERPCQNS